MVKYEMTYPESRKELISIIETIKRESSILINQLRAERDNARKEVRDLKLELGALQIFRNSITKSLDKLQKEIGNGN